MVMSRVKHLTLDERRLLGAVAADRVPPSAVKEWEPAADRADPVALLEEQNLRREPDLVPVRHGRMMVSPFTFYRGAAKVMAADLATAPRAGLDVQLCGDAHLSNFGAFASPERRLLFDLNDFDETLPGPFEYDVARLSASFTIAARNNGFSRADAKSVTRTTLRAYREAMAGFARMRTLDIWYAHLAEEDILAAAKSLAKAADGAKSGKSIKGAEKAIKRGERNIAKARTRDSLQALSKLAERVDGRYRLVSQPPIVVPLRDVAQLAGLTPDIIDRIVHDQFRAYRSTLQDDRRHLLERFEVVDVARKVVGVGSVGTRAYIVLLQGRDEEDPLFLQLKEATASVLEDHLPKSRYRQHGERVVNGQRLMQAASDIFLGWTKGVEEDRWFYFRQLRDMKASADVEAMDPVSMRFYAGLCGWTLARAHARTGDAVAIGAYLGDGDSFDKAMTSFARRYADQNEQDYQAFTGAVESGRLEAVTGV